MRKQAILSLFLALACDTTLQAGCCKSGRLYAGSMVYSQSLGSGARFAVVPPYQAAYAPYVATGPLLYGYGASPFSPAVSASEVESQFVNNALTDLVFRLVDRLVTNTGTVSPGSSKLEEIEAKLKKADESITETLEESTKALKLADEDLDERLADIEGRMKGIEDKVNKLVDADLNSRLEKIESQIELIMQRLPAQPDNVSPGTK